MSKSPTNKSFFRSKPFLGVLFCIWATGAISMVSLLSSQEYGDEGNTLVASAIAQPTIAAPGWTVHHQLVAGDYVSELVATHLIARRPMPGIKEDVRLLGSSSRLEDRLAAAGWHVIHEANATRSQPMLSVTAPDGKVAWEGGFDSPELRQGNGSILDRLLISRVVTGQQLASRVVPYGRPVPSSRPL
jgi:hypothetical protein